MIALDTNILVHGHQRESHLHLQARDMVRKMAEGSLSWAICYHSFIEFYGVVTRPRAWSRPSTPSQAMDQIGAWRESPSLFVLFDSAQTLDVFQTLVTKAGITGGQAHDARIAACCLANGVSELWTADRDFSMFKKLRTRNPFAID